jgi:hypothetical protein
MTADFAEAKQDDLEVAEVTVGTLGETPALWVGHTVTYPFMTKRCHCGTTNVQVANEYSPYAYCPNSINTAYHNDRPAFPLPSRE